MSNMCQSLLRWKVMVGTHTHTQPTDGISRTTKVFGNY